MRFWRVFGEIIGENYFLLVKVSVLMFTT